MRTRMRRDITNEPSPYIIAGIDPGLSGAICLLNGTKCEVFDIPIFNLERGGKNKREIDIHLLCHLLRTKIDHCFLEQVGAMPGQGVSSMFAFGQTFGIIKGILVANDIPYTLVPPRRWKSFLRVPAAKDGSRARASQLLPNAAGQWALKKHEGRAEASLIALYGKMVISTEH